MKLNDLHIDQYIEGIRGGNIALLSRAITFVESTRSEHRAFADKLINSILPFTGNSLRIGVTGIPGVGKSTFIEGLGLHLIQKKKKIAVLAIDPSSTISKGSILGDKTRMEMLSNQERAFIRPTASSGNLGGLARKTKEAMLLCEAAGFDIIIIETVGVGQSETEVRNITDFFLLLMLAGSGDELQGIKRGIMEMVDGLVINKADGNNIEKAKAARAEFAKAIHFFPPHPSGWIPKVKTCSAFNHEGVEEVWQLIEEFISHQTLNGYLSKLRQEQDIYSFEKLLNEELHLKFLSNKQNKQEIELYKQQIVKQEISLYSAVNKILANLGD